MQTHAILVPASPPIHSFGFKKVCRILTDFCKRYPTLPLVSVGCGIAIVEREARAQVKNDFYLVDPNPGSYYPFIENFLHRLIVEAGMPATHSYTKELVTERPELTKGNGCLLFLNWCDFGNHDYDMEAVRLLKPRAILTIVDILGSAGSEQFHRFLKSETQYKKHRIYSIKQAKKEKYACSHETISIQWLVPVNDQLECINEVTECCQVHDENNTGNIRTLEARRIECVSKTPKDVLEKLTFMLKDLVSS